MSSTKAKLPDLSKLPDKTKDFDLEKMLEAGCHFGHHASKWHPRMKEWIYTQKDGVHIIDLIKTADQLKKACNLAYNFGAEGKTMVVVGTKRQASNIITKLLEKYKFMYVTSRWLGGMLTNWPQVKTSLKKMIDIETGLAGDKYEGYTKYEIVQLEKDLNRLKRFFQGVRDLKGQPDLLFVVDPKKEQNVVLEAQTVGVPVVALTDTDTDPTGIDLVIPANDDAVQSIEFIVEAVVSAYEAGKKEAK